jgi:hypothetical protein
MLSVLYVHMYVLCNDKTELRRVLNFRSIFEAPVCLAEVQSTFNTHARSFEARCTQQLAYKATLLRSFTPLLLWRLF